MSRLERVRARLEASRGRLISALNLLEEPAFSARPSPGAWSAAHVVEHLAIVEQNVARGIGAALAGKLVVGRRWSDPLFRVVYRSNLYRVIRVRTRAAFDPPEAPARPAALAKLAATRATLFATIDGADPELLWKQRLRHPILGPLSMEEMLDFVAYHEDRHRLQLARIRKALSSARRSSS